MGPVAGVPTAPAHPQPALRGPPPRPLGQGHRRGVPSRPRGLHPMGTARTLEAVEDAFGHEIDYAMLVKLYGSAFESERRYSPPECIGAQAHGIQGNPAISGTSRPLITSSGITSLCG